LQQSLDFQKWSSQLEDISTFRKEQNFHAAQYAKWALLCVFLFVILWIIFRIEIAIASILVAVFLYANFAQKINFLSKTMKNKNTSDAKASLAEEILFQNIAQEKEPWLKVSFSGPTIWHEIKKSELISGRIDFVDGTRCLAGCYKDLIPFCATYVNACRIDEHLNAQRKLQKTTKIVFQGIFVVLDFPKAQNGWVRIETDNLAKIGWLANDWRQLNDSNYIQIENPEFERFFHVQANSRVDGFRILNPDLIINLVEFAQKRAEIPMSMMFRDGMLLMALPMKKNPFALTENENIWKNDLEYFQNIVFLVADFITTLKPEKQYPHQDQKI
jgi:hypothetical protein